jgi:stringent starvation protein B
VTNHEKVERAVVLGRAIAERREELHVLEEELLSLFEEQQESDKHEDEADDDEPDVPETSEINLPPDFEEQTRNLQKCRVFEQLIEMGPVLVHLDPRRNTIVPDPYASRAMLTLRFGRNLSPPVIGMGWDDEDLGATLTFGGEQHIVVVPWEAMFALTSEATGQTATWIADVPEEFRTSAAAPATKQSHLSLVPEDATSGDLPAPPPRTEVPDLRVVPTEYGPQVVEEVQLEPIVARDYMDDDDPGAA